MTNNNGNKVRAIFNSVLDEANKGRRKGPLSQYSSPGDWQDFIATVLNGGKTPTVPPKGEEEPKEEPKKPEQQNSSTQINYRNGIKVLFETVLDELTEGGSKRAFMDTQDDSDDGAAAAAAAYQASQDKAKADADEEMYKKFKKGELKRKARNRWRSTRTERLGKRINSGRMGKR